MKKMKKSSIRKLKTLIIIILASAVAMIVFGVGPEKIVSLRDKIIPSSVAQKIDEEVSENLKNVLGEENGLEVLRNAYNNYKNSESSGLEVPSRVGNHQVVDQTYYTISWNTEHKVADWVSYTITKDNLNKNAASRTEDFREDPKVSTTSTLSDYKGSGYDRGHLLSAASAKYSEEAMSSTFLLTNMVPQIHRYNAGVWLKAEDAERDATRLYGVLYAVSGPVLTTGPYKTIGDGVTVPNECYKALLVLDNNGNYQTIALVIPQEYTDGNLKPYLLTVNELEYLTGIDFFPSLDDSIEEIVENSYDLSKWPSVFSK